MFQAHVDMIHRNGARSSNMSCRPDMELVKSERSGLPPTSEPPSAECCRFAPPKRLHATLVRNTEVGNEGRVHGGARSHQWILSSSYDVPPSRLANCSPFQVANQALHMYRSRSIAALLGTNERARPCAFHCCLS